MAVVQSGLCGVNVYLITRMVRAGVAGLLCLGGCAALVDLDQPYQLANFDTGDAQRCASFVEVPVPLGYEVAGISAISGDGRVVIGEAEFGTYQVFHWSASTGQQTLLPVDPTRTTRANAVSADGGVVYGYTEYNDGVCVVGAGGTGSTQSAPGGPSCVDDSFWQQPFRWTSAGVEDLPLPDGATGGEVVDTSADGKVAIGFVYGDTFLNKPVRWENDGVIDLEPLLGRAMLTAVSNDGDILVGNMDLGAFWFRWSDHTVVMLDAVLRGTGSSTIGVSADGQVVVGMVEREDGVEPFRWNQRDDSEDRLAPLNQVWMMSGDGQTVLGSMVTEPNGPAHEVDANLGAVELGPPDIASVTVLLDANGVRPVQEELERAGFSPALSEYPPIVNAISNRGRVLAGEYESPEPRIIGWSAVLGEDCDAARGTAPLSGDL